MRELQALAWKPFQEEVQRLAETNFLLTLELGWRRQRERRALNELTTMMRDVRRVYAQAAAYSSGDDEDIYDNDDSCGERESDEEDALSPGKHPYSDSEDGEQRS